jgi:hypothetical protein
VRFEWHADALSPAWRQSFSYDSGSTWKLNWEMMLSRDDEAGSQQDAAGALLDQPEAARTD